MLGPQGIAGHAHLFVSRMGSRHMAFRCRVCGTTWIRLTNLHSRGQALWHGPDTPAAREATNEGFALPQCYTKPPIF